MRAVRRLAVRRRGRRECRRDVLLGDFPMVARVVPLLGGECLGPGDGFAGVRPCCSPLGRWITRYAPLGRSVIGIRRADLEGSGRLITSGEVYDRRGARRGMGLPSTGSSRHGTLLRGCRGMVALLFPLSLADG